MVLGMVRMEVVSSSIEKPTEQQKMGAVSGSRLCRDPALGSCSLGCTVDSERVLENKVAEQFRTMP